MENNWLFENKEIKTINQFPEGSVAFVYKVTNLTNNKYYIGKKILYNTLNKKLGKTEMLEHKLKGLKGRPPTRKKIIKESDWKTYYGSNSELKEDIKKLGKENFKREILKICKSKKLSSYWEEWYLFNNHVLMDDLCYNSNISGAYYRKDFEI